MPDIVLDWREAWTARTFALPDSDSCTDSRA